MTSFAEYRERWSLLPAHVVAEMAFTTPPAEQAAMWAELAEHCALRTEMENTYEGRMVEPWCPRCRDRTVAHKVGACPRTRAPRAPTSTAPTGAAALPTDDPLKQIPPREYVERLLGVAVPDNGWIRCPFHADRRPSFQVKDTHWICWAGCGAGSIIDLGALLWRITPRASGYWEIRDRLVAHLEGVVNV